MPEILPYRLRGIPDEVPTDLQGPEPALIQSQPAAPSAPAGAQAVAARTQSIEASQGEAPITDSDGWVFQTAAAFSCLQAIAPVHTWAKCGLALY